MDLRVGVVVSVLAVAVLTTATPAAAASTSTDIAPVVSTVVSPNIEPAQWGGWGYPWAGGYPGGWGYPWAGGYPGDWPGWGGAPAASCDPSSSACSTWGAGYGGQTWGGWGAPWMGIPPAPWGVPPWGGPIPPPFLGPMPGTGLNLFNLGVAQTISPLGATGLTGLGGLPGLTGLTGAGTPNVIVIPCC